MTLQERLCKTFCDGIEVAAVGAGFSVATGFEDQAGDRIIFYVIHDPSTGLYRLEDDGSLVPTLIATGSNVTEGQRRRVFDAILRQTGAEYDDDAGELRSPVLTEDEVPIAALRFMTTLSRVAALSTMRAELVQNTFREDAIQRIKADLAGKVQIVEDEPISPALAEVRPDLVLRGASEPVAVFIAVSDARLSEAIFLRMIADYEAHQPCAIVGLIDREGSRLISSRMRQRAQNRLDAMPVFYGEETAAVARIGREASVSLQ